MLGPFAVALLASPALSASGMSQKEFNHWLKEEVTWIISRGEQRAARELTGDEDREAFVRHFWEIRDPTPGTPENEYRDTHYARLEYVNREFREEGEGWRSDRGRVYILHGAPVSRNRQRTQEVWIYNSNPYGQYYTGPILLVFAQGASSFQATQLSDTLTARHRNAPTGGLAELDIPRDLGVSSNYRLIVAGPINELSASANETVPGGGPASERLLQGTVESDRYIADILRSPGEILDDERNERQRRLEGLQQARSRMLENFSQQGDLKLELMTQGFRQGDTTGLHFSVSIPPDQLFPGQEQKKRRKRKDSEAALTDLLCEMVGSDGDRARDSLDGTMEAQPGQELVFSGWFELLASDSQIRCLALFGHDRIGWVAEELPEIGKQTGTGLSSLLLTQEAMRLPPDHPPLPLVYQNVQFRLPALPRFAPSPLYLFFQVFQGVDSQGLPREFQYDYTVRSGNQAVLSSLPLIPLEEGEVQGRNLVFARTLDFSRLRPGSYSLQLRLLESGSRRPITRTINFRIVSTRD